MRTYIARWLMVVFSFLALFFNVSTLHAKDSALIIFDGSGSMWGQIEGKHKIEIAREVMGTLVKDWNEDIDLGLMAYGHREKGNCADIEVLFPVDTPDSKKILNIINKLSPKGKTPISQSLKQAAETLRYTEDPATVILISDGEETCNADPCTTSHELEENGIYFTAHVIGFDIGNNRKARDQLRCIADNTGGKYFEAKDSVDLKNSLFEVRKEVDFPDKIIDLEGTWSAVSTFHVSNQVKKGTLTITQKGNYFTGISTTGNSKWNGTFDKEKNIFKAWYERKDGSIGGHITLNVSKDKRSLDGEWNSVDGSVYGSYTAKKIGN